MEHLWLVKNLHVLKCLICSFLQLLGVLSFEFGSETFLCYYWCFSRAYLFILSKLSLFLEYFPKVSGLKTGNIVRQGYLRFYYCLIGFEIWWQLANRSVVIKKIILYKYWNLYDSNTENFCYRGKEKCIRKSSILWGIFLIKILDQQLRTSEILLMHKVLLINSLLAKQQISKFHLSEIRCHTSDRSIFQIGTGITNALINARKALDWNPKDSRLELCLDKLSCIIIRSEIYIWMDIIFCGIAEDDGRPIWVVWFCIYCGKILAVSYHSWYYRKLGFPCIPKCHGWYKIVLYELCRLKV